MQQPVSHPKHQALQTKQIILMCDHLDHKGDHLVSTARQQHGRGSLTYNYEETPPGITGWQTKFHRKVK